MPINIHCGTNISEWLSQSKLRGSERATFFTSRDVAFIAGLGFDHIRLPVDEEQLWDESGKPDSEAFGLLEAALDWCAEYGLKAVVDLHLLRTHNFIEKTTPSLFTDPTEANRFAGLWSDLSHFLRGRPLSQVAYELLNEPIAADPLDWNRVAMAGYQAIRKHEPLRTIVLGSNTWNQTHTFNELAVPVDQHLILTFHYYHPMPITHYGASWWEGGVWDGPVNYPGRLISAEDQADFTSAAPGNLSHLASEVWDRERIRQDLQIPLKVARYHGCPLYCGEFGAYEKAPLELRLAWYKDMISLLKEYDIAWANWDYKGGFAPVIKGGEVTDIVPIILE